MTPNFDQIALSLWNDGDGSNMPHILEQLRQVWNARGAADIAEIETALDGETFTEDLVSALRSLNR